MSGIILSGSILDKIVIDRDGTRETVLPTNRADNPNPVPFSVEVYVADAATADEIVKSATQIAASLRASEITNAINEASIATGQPPIVAP